MFAISGLVDLEWQCPKLVFTSCCFTHNKQIVTHRTHIQVRFYWSLGVLFYGYGVQVIRLFLSLLSFIDSELEAVATKETEAS